MSKKRNRFWNKYAELLFIISVHLGGNNYSLEKLVLVVVVVQNINMLNYDLSVVEMPLL